jgi:hypothetical protein
LNASGSFGSAEGKNVPTGVVANYYENIISTKTIFKEFQLVLILNQFHY